MKLILLTTAFSFSFLSWAIAKQEDQPESRQILFIRSCGQKYFDAINLLDDSKIEIIDSVYWSGMDRGIWLTDSRIFYPTPWGTHSPLAAPYYVVYDYKDHILDSINVSGNNDCYGEFAKGSAFYAEIEKNLLRMWRVNENSQVTVISEIGVKPFASLISINLSPSGKYATCSYAFWNITPSPVENILIDLKTNTLKVLNKGVIELHDGVIFDSDSSFYYSGFGPGRGGEKRDGIFHYNIGGSIEMVATESSTLMGFYGGKYLVALDRGAIISELCFFDALNNYRKTLIQQGIITDRFYCDWATEELIYTTISDTISEKGLLQIYSFKENNKRKRPSSNLLIQGK